MTNGDAGPIPTFSSSPRSPRPTPSASATTTGPPRALLAAVNGTIAWRAEKGSCGGATPLLQQSTDGGTTWADKPLPAGVRAVLGLRATTTSVSVLIARGDGCATTTQTSADSGASWDDTADGVHIAGLKADDLLTSAGSVAAPCSAPFEVYEGKFTTAVACDGSVQWRQGSGPWVPVAVSGVRSLTDNGDDYTIARTGVASCDGVHIESLTAVGVSPSTIPQPVGCAAGAADSSDTPVVVSRAGDSLWLWAGDETRVSENGGTSW